MPLDQTASGAHESSGTSNYCSPCLLSTSWLCWVKNPLHPLQARLRGQTRPPGLKHERSTVCRGQKTLPQKLAQQLLPLAEDTLAERLRRRSAKPMGSPRVGSNPTGVVRVQGGFVWKANTLQVWNNSLKKKRLNHPALGSCGAMEPDRQKGCSGN